METSLERLRGVGLRLVRWSVGQSRGELSVDPKGDHPVVEIRFPTPEPRAESPGFFRPQSGDLHPNG